MVSFKKNVAVPKKSLLYRKKNLSLPFETCMPLDKGLNIFDVNLFKRKLQAHFFNIAEDLEINIILSDIKITHKRADFTHTLSLEEAQHFLDPALNPSSAEKARVALVGALTPFILMDTVSQEFGFIPPNDGYDELALLVKMLPKIPVWVVNFLIFSAGTGALGVFGLKPVCDHLEGIHSGIEDLESESKSFKDRLSRFKNLSDSEKQTIHQKLEAIEEKLEKLYPELFEHRVEFGSLLSMTGGTLAGSFEALVHGVGYTYAKQNHGDTLAYVEAIRGISDLVSSSFLGFGSFLSIINGAMTFKEALETHVETQTSLENLERVIQDLKTRKDQLPESLRTVFDSMIPHIERYQTYLMSEERIEANAKMSRGIGLMAGGAILTTLNAWTVAAEVGGVVALAALIPNPASFALLAVGVSLVFLGLSMGLWLERRELNSTLLEHSEKLIKRDFMDTFKKEIFQSESIEPEKLAEFGSSRLENSKQAWLAWKEIRHYYKNEKEESKPDEKKILSALEKSRAKGNVRSGILSLASFVEPVQALKFSSLSSDQAPDNEKNKRRLEAFLGLEETISDETLYKKWCDYLTEQGVLSPTLFEMDQKSLELPVIRTTLREKLERGWIGNTICRPISITMNKWFGLKLNEEATVEKTRDVECVDFAQVRQFTGEKREQFLNISISVFFNSKYIGKKLRSDIVAAAKVAADPGSLQPERCEDNLKGSVCKSGCGHSEEGRDIKGKVDQLRKNVLGLFDKSDDKVSIELSKIIQELKLKLKTQDKRFIPDAKVYALNTNAAFGDSIETHVKLTENLVIESKLTPAKTLWEENRSGKKYGRTLKGETIYGITSGTTTSDFLPNFWEAKLDVVQKGVKKTLKSYRHTILSACDIQNNANRRAANQKRAQDFLLSLLTKEDIEKAQNAAQENRYYDIHISSISLVYTKVNSKERQMFCEQLEALSRISGQRTISLPNGTQLNLNVAIEACNFGTSGKSLLSWNGGWDSFIEKTNERYWDNTLKRANFWLTVNSTSEDKGLVESLLKQIKEILQKKSYKTANNDPYKLVARIHLLNMLIGVKSCMNCESGHKETSLGEVEAKFLYAFWQMHQALPEPGRDLTDSEQGLIEKLLCNSGNFELHTLNTCSSGYDIKDMAYRLGLKKRYGVKCFNYITGAS